MLKKHIFSLRRQTGRGPASCRSVGATAPAPVPGPEAAESGALPRRLPSHLPCSQPASRGPRSPENPRPRRGTPRLPPREEAHVHVWPGCLSQGPDDRSPTLTFMKRPLRAQHLVAQARHISHEHIAPPPGACDSVPPTEGRARGPWTFRSSSTALFPKQSREQKAPGKHGDRTRCSNDPLGGGDGRTLIS